jgi:hypothetical protein
MCLVEFNCVFCEGLRVGGIVERSVTSVYKISWPSTKPPTRIGTKALKGVGGSGLRTHQKTPRASGPTPG